MIKRLLLACLLTSLLLPSAAHAQFASFDLAGPSLRVAVTRGGETLPIGAVPNLSSGDQLLLRTEFPADQSARYLLVVAFLRGATNPPPKAWFFQMETWKRKDSELRLAVPQGAGQVLLFLAPETRGGFDAVVRAVRGRPGAFVRASQNLNQASPDHSRFDAFLNGMKAIDPVRTSNATQALARSLAVRFNAECLEKQPDLQAACLAQRSESLVLNDGHSASIADMLTGKPTDLAYRISATPEAGSGYYSPYIGVVRDLARIFGAFQTARYQYIPALAVDRGDQLALLLNTAPSFHKPQSVLVTALPAVDLPQVPPLRASEPGAVYCLTRPGLVLPVEGAPLIYSTRYARSLVLRLRAGDRTTDMPVTAKAERGGLVLESTGALPARLGHEIEASLHGLWGFQPFEGPRFRLQNGQVSSWRPAAETSLVVGRDNQVELRGAAPACVDQIMLRTSTGTIRVKWKEAGSDALSLTLPLGKTRPGAVELLIKQHGDQEAATLKLKAFAESSRIDAFALHAGDHSGMLTGGRLDQVGSLRLGNLEFRPGALARAGKVDQLELTSADVKESAKLAAGEARAARIVLKDGRTVGLKVRIQQARPSATLISRSIEPEASAAPIAIRLPGDDALSPGSRMTFSVRAGADTSFAAGGAIEIKAASGAASSAITPANGLNLTDARMAVATIDPGKILGPTAFGPLLYRIVQDRMAGDWQPLATLVRLPVLRAMDCRDADQACTLAGSNLFLIASVLGDARFADAVEVPEGYTGSTLKVPQPKDGQIYFKLRDDPRVIARASSPG